MADLSKKVLFSIALKIDFVKCCSGPIEFPNHPSSEIFTMRFVSMLDFWTKSVKYDFFFRNAFIELLSSDALSD